MTGTPKLAEIRHWQFALFRYPGTWEPLPLTMNPSVAGLESGQGHDPEQKTFADFGGV
jgi:hypothetical protein